MSFLSDWLATWRDYLVDGVPSSGIRQPIKSEVRALGTALQAILDGLAADDAIVVVRPYTGLPPNTFGKDGELTFDATAKAIYGPKATVWPSTPVSLVGPSAYAGTSMTSNTIPASVSPPVSMTFSTQAGLAYVLGLRLQAIATDGTSLVEGAVTAYSAGSLTLSVDRKVGAGTYTSWNIAPAGPAGAAGTPGTSGGAIVETPAYTNVGGQGDRVTGNVVVVTASPTLIASNASRLVDGSTTTPGNACIFSAVAVAGLYIEFDFGAGAQRVLTEATWTQSTNASHGAFQWYGVNDGASPEAIGNSFTLGGLSGANTLTELASNVKGYRRYRLVGVSGTASAAPFLQEITFKIGKSVLDARGVTTAGGAVGQVLAKKSAADFDFSWTNAPGDPLAGLPTSGLMSAWLFDETSGNTCFDRTGNYPIDLSLPTTPNVTRTARGLLTQSGLVQTPSLAGVQTVAILYRVKRLETAGFILSGGSGSGNGYVASNVDLTYSAWVGNGWDVHVPGFRVSTGGGALEMNRGGWLLLITDFGSAKTSALGFGGRHSTTTSRCAEFEIAGAVAWNRALTGAAERSQVYNAFRRLAMSKRIVLNWRDAVSMVDVVSLWGESTADGRSKIVTAGGNAGLSAADAALRMDHTFIQPANGTTNWARPKRFELGYNQQTTAPTTDFGFEYGLAYQQRANGATRLRDLYINKYGKGSTFLAPVGTVGSGGTVGIATTWAANETTHGGLFALATTSLLDLEQGLRSHGLGPNFVGLGFLIGQNDGLDTAYPVDAATYQGYMQTFLNQFIAETGLASFKFVVPRARSGTTGSNATALGYVRQAQADFVTANSSIAVLRSTDAYTLNTDGLHFDGPASKTGGIDMYADFAL